MPAQRSATARASRATCGREHGLGGDDPPQRHQRAVVLGLLDALEDVPVDVLRAEPHLDPRARARRSSRQRGRARGTRRRGRGAPGPGRRTPVRRAAARRAGPRRSPAGRAASAAAARRASAARRPSLTSTAIPPPAPTPVARSSRRPPSAHRGLQVRDAVGALPGELGQLATEVPVRGGPAVDRAQQVEVADDRGRAQVEDLADRRRSGGRPGTVSVPNVSTYRPTGLALPIA